MENSVTSMNKHPSSSNNGKTTEDSPEESSWTFYLQDFPYDHHDHDYSTSFISNSYEDNSPSLVSDAVSSAARKAPDDNNEAAAFTSAKSYCKNSSFKRRKAKTTAVVNDHDLEDTASSPVNSPKVSYINQLNHSQNTQDIKDVAEANICQNISTDGIVGPVGEENNSQSELKKKGLCLVPLSMLTNYFGRQV